MRLDDTIVAISSAVGAAARMIVRLAGPRAIELFEQIASTAPRPGAHRVSIRVPAALAYSAGAIPAHAYLFRAPHSYTGDDLVELHLPGNPLLCQLVVDDLIARGARHAEAGEFTSRAFLRGRLDLSEAEGVALTIAASNDAELRAARQLLAGELARRLAPAMESLAGALALVEAGIDFSEEDISFITPDDLRSRLRSVQASLDAMLAETARFERLSHVPTFALVGRPNAGKSTLLNALAGHERAVVSPVAGTTRDALSASVTLDRGVVTLIDVAGIEPVADDVHGIHAAMQDRARRTVEEADFVLLVRDVTDSMPATELPRTPDLILRNKIDLRSTVAPANAIDVSAATGAGLDDLRRAMASLAFGTGSGTLALNARHLGAIDEARRSLERALDAIDTSAAELIATDLRQALDALGSILGQVTPDDVIGRIFATFCIGK